MSFTALKGDPVNALVRNCLLEERTGESAFQYTSPTGGAYTLKWNLNNSLGLVFVAVYQRALKLLYVDALLDKVNRAFSPVYKPNCYDYSDFSSSFQRMLHDAEAKADAEKRAPAGTAPTKSPATANGLQENGGNNKKSSADVSSEDDDDDDDDDAAAFAAASDKPKPISASGSAVSLASDMTGASSDGDGVENAEKDGAFNASAISKKLAKRAMPGSKIARSTKDAPKAASKKISSKPSGKQARVWSDLGGAGKAETGPLDFTDGTAPNEAVERPADFAVKSLVDVEESIDYDSEEDEDPKAAGGKGGLLSSFIRNIGVNVVGTQALTKEDILPALAELKKKLMERNVAEEIAAKLTDSVATSLEGQKLQSFTRVSSAVRTAVEEALTRILTPKRSIDILREVRASKGRGKPYIITFVGVNGVGKSTNLAKVAYWLLQNNIKVMIAACDTFRSGAVEQLKTHCARLDVPLYERGYEKDPAKVAFEGAKAAQRAGIDVLLVDTAGRMQDNEPLMRALSNLINLNEPDLVLFVGEALVGNDAVDQLTKFNRRLVELSPGGQQSLIDGIVLTKFDTIDDKVGAALSMVYTSGAPIMFVGCGQTYVDLKRLHVKSVVHSLLK